MEWSAAGCQLLHLDHFNWTFSIRLTDGFRWNSDSRSAFLWAHCLADYRWNFSWGLLNFCRTFSLIFGCILVDIFGVRSQYSIAWWLLFFFFMGFWLSFGDFLNEFKSTLDRFSVVFSWIDCLADLRSNFSWSLLNFCRAFSLIFGCILVNIFGVRSQYSIAWWLLFLKWNLVEFWRLFERI